MTSNILDHPTTTVLRLASSLKGPQNKLLLQAIANFDSLRCCYYYYYYYY